MVNFYSIPFNTWNKLNPINVIKRNKFRIFNYKNLININIYKCSYEVNIYNIINVYHKLKINCLKFDPYKLSILSSWFKFKYTLPIYKFPYIDMETPKFKQNIYNNIKLQTNNYLYTFKQCYTQNKKYKTFTNIDISSSIGELEKFFELPTHLEETAFLSLTSGYLTSYISSYRPTTKLNVSFFSIYDLLTFNQIKLNPIYILAYYNELIYNLTAIIKPGELLLSKIFSPKSVLIIIYNNLLKFYSQSQSSKIALVKLKNIILESLIKYYYYNKIILPSVYFELILKHMCSNVQLQYSSISSFISGDIVNIFWVTFLNQSFFINNYPIILYSPIIIGISKCSLASHGFLTSFSFQTTLKLLAKSAIECKVDWLTSLKANILTSDLLPSGTGWTRHFSI